MRFYTGMFFNFAVNKSLRKGVAAGLCLSLSTFPVANALSLPVQAQDPNPPSIPQKLPEPAPLEAIQQNKSDRKQENPFLSGRTSGFSLPDLTQWLKERGILPPEEIISPEKATLATADQSGGTRKNLTGDKVINMLQQQIEAALGGAKNRSTSSPPLSTLSPRFPSIAQISSFLPKSDLPLPNAISTVSEVEPSPGGVGGSAAQKEAKDLGQIGQLTSPVSSSSLPSSALTASSALPLRPLKDKINSTGNALIISGGQNVQFSFNPFVYTEIDFISTGGVLEATQGFTLTPNLVFNGTINILQADDSTNPLIVSGALSGVGFQKTGPGQLILTGTNNFPSSGSSSLPYLVQVSQGTLTISSATNLGSASPAGSTGTFNTINVGNGTFQATQGMTLGQAFYLGYNAILQADDSAVGLTLSGPITGIGGGFTKTGQGILTLAAASTNYAGPTLVKAGTLQVSGVLSQSNVTIASGAMLSGAGIIDQSVTVQSGGTLQFDPARAQARTMTVGNITFQPGAHFEYGMQALTGGNDLLVVTGNAQLGGTLDLFAFPNATFETGVYPILTAQNVTGTFTLGTLPPGFSTADVSLDYTNPKQVNLMLQGSPVPGPFDYWDGADNIPNNQVDGGAGTWDNTTTNLTNSTGTGQSNWNGQSIIFAGASSGLVTLGAPISVQSISFLLDGYQINGGKQYYTLTLTGPSITVNSGVGAQISAIIADSGNVGLQTNGTGTLTLSASNIYTGPTIVNAGTLVISAVGSIASSQGGVVLNGSALLDVSAANQTLQGLSSTSSSTRVNIGSNTLTFNLSAGSNLTFWGVIGSSSTGVATANPGNITLTGQGSLTLIGSNKYVGLTTIGPGTTLQLGNNRVSGALSTRAIVNNGTLTLNRSDTIRYSILISGTGNLIKNGDGTLVLVGTNTYSGNTTLISGILAPSSDNALGSGNLQFNAGTLQAYANISPPNAIVVGPGTQTIDTASYTLTLKGALSGSGNVTKINPGTLVLAANSSAYTGAVTVNGGSLNVTGSIGSNVTINNGAILNGSGQIGGMLTVNSGGLIQLDPAGKKAQTLTIGAGALAAGSLFNYGAVAPSPQQNDLIIVSGAFSSQGLNIQVVDYTGTGTLAAGNYPFLQYNAAYVPTGTINVSSVPSGYTASLFSVRPCGTNMLCVIVPTKNVSVLYFKGLTLSRDGSGQDESRHGGAGVWSNDVSQTNWTDSTGVAKNVWAPGNIATFSGNAGTITLGDNVFVHAVNFLSDGYQIGGSEKKYALNIIGSTSDFSVNANYKATIAAAISGSSLLIKKGAGTLLLLGDSTYTGGTDIQAGTLSLGSDRAAGRGAIKVDGGALQASRDISLANALVYQSGTQVMDTGAYAVSLSGALSGSGAFNKIGGGSLTLSADSSAYKGAVNIVAGNMNVKGKLGSDVTVNTGATLNGSGTIGGNVNIESGAHLQLDPAGAQIQTLQVGGLTLSGIWNWLGNSTRGDSIKSAGAVTLGGTLNIAAVTGTSLGTTSYTLITTSSSTTPEGTLLIGNVPSGYSATNFSLGALPGKLVLNVVPSRPSLKIEEEKVREGEKITPPKLGEVSEIRENKNQVAETKDSAKGLSEGPKELAQVKPLGCTGNLSSNKEQGGMPGSTIKTSLKTDCGPQPAPEETLKRVSSEPATVPVEEKHLAEANTIHKRALIEEEHILEEGSADPQTEVPASVVESQESQGIEQKEETGVLKNESQSGRVLNLESIKLDEAFTTEEPITLQGDKGKAEDHQIIGPSEDLFGPGAIIISQSVSSPKPEEGEKSGIPTVSLEQAVPQGTPEKIAEGVAPPIEAITLSSDRRDNRNKKSEDVASPLLPVVLAESVDKKEEGSISDIIQLRESLEKIQKESLLQQEEKTRAAAFAFRNSAARRHKEKEGERGELNSSLQRSDKKEITENTSAALGPQEKDRGKETEKEAGSLSKNAAVGDVPSHVPTPTDTSASLPSVQSEKVSPSGGHTQIVRQDKANGQATTPLLEIVDNSDEKEPLPSAFHPSAPLLPSPSSVAVPERVSLPAETFSAANSGPNLMQNVQTLNQEQVAVTVQKILQLSPNYSPLFSSLLSASPGEVTEVLDQLSGEIHASTETALIENSRYIASLLLNRLQGDRLSEAARLAIGPTNAQRADVLSYTTSNPMKKQNDLLPASTSSPFMMPERAVSGTNIVLWGNAFGTWGYSSSKHHHQHHSLRSPSLPYESDKGHLHNVAHSLGRSAGGFFLGGENVLNNQWRIGVTGGYERGNLHVRTLKSSTQTDNYIFGTYLGGMWHALTGRLGATYTWHRLEVKRHISFVPAAFYDRERVKYNARTGQIFGELGYGIQIWNQLIEPFVGLNFTSLSTSPFVEPYGPLGLRGSSMHKNMTFSTLGIHSTGFFEVGQFILMGRTTIGWQHAFGTVRPNMTLAFRDVGPEFTISGLPIAREALLFELGGDLVVKTGMTIGVIYSGRFSPKSIDQTAKATFKCAF